jgi:hypothetical protein
VSEVVDIKVIKKQRDKDRYAELVLKAWDDQEHADKRKILDLKAEMQIAARERL